MQIEQSLGLEPAHRQWIGDQNEGKDSASPKTPISTIFWLIRNGTDPIRGRITRPFPRIDTTLNISNISCT